MLMKFTNFRRLRKLLLSLVFTAVFFASFILPVAPTFAQGMSGMTDMGGVRTMKATPNMSPLTRFMEVDNDPLFTILDVMLDIAGVIIMLVAIFIISKSVREYGKSTVGVAILYLLTATLVLGAIRCIFILDDDNILNVKDVAEMTAWHSLFYYAVILFYIGGLTFTKLVSTKNGKSSYPRAIFMLIFSIVVSAIVLLFYSQSFVQNFLIKYEQPTVFYTFGWWHLIAIFLSVCIALYLNTVKNKFKGYSGVIGNIIIAIFLLASIHTWELLNETWRVIVVSDDFGEFIERVLWIPVFIFILLSYIRLRKISFSESNQAQVSAVSPATPSPMPPPGVQPTPVTQVPQPVTQSPGVQVPLSTQQPGNPMSQPTPITGTPSSVPLTTDSTAPQISSQDPNKQNI